ncbi:MAG TPA: hypothetical protein VH593_31480 [Ktedonobacteraceae bacterium]|jgi:hypothetical protein
MVQGDRIQQTTYLMSLRAVRKRLDARRAVPDAFPALSGSPGYARCLFPYPLVVRRRR